MLTTSECPWQLTALEARAIRHAAMARLWASGGGAGVPCGWWPRESRLLAGISIDRRVDPDPGVKAGTGPESGSHVGHRDRARARAVLCCCAKLRKPPQETARLRMREVFWPRRGRCRREQRTVFSPGVLKAHIFACACACACARAHAHACSLKPSLSFKRFHGRRFLMPNQRLVCGVVLRRSSIADSTERTSPYQLAVRQVNS